ncbi:MAG: hypothetical protein PHT24_06975, partial [Endomicrobiaceae bacterium]|nr:hypothetical protein [Endomicrobiaceae bacterium]
EPMSGYGDNQERGNFIVGQWYESDNAIVVEKAENLPIEQKNNESWWQKIIDFVSKIFKTPENVNVVQNSMIPLSENKKNEAAITQTNDSSDVEKSEEASVLKEISFNSYDSSCDGIFTGYLQYSQNGWEYQSKEVLKSNDQETVNGLFKSKTENCQIEIMAGPPLGGSFCGFGEDRKKDCQEDKITINGNEINRNYGAYVSGSEEFGAQYYLGVDDKRCCYQNDCGYTFMFFIDAPDSSIGQKCMKDFEEMLKTFQIKNDAIGKKETVSNNENNQPIASGIKEIGSYAEVKASYGRYIVIDKYVYMLKGNAVDVVDVSDVNNPKIISSYNYYNDTRDIDYDGKYLYIAGGTYGMAIVDISDPYHLKEIGRGVSSDLGIRQYAIGIEIDGDKAYMCGHTMTGLALADVSDPNSPKRIASYNIACGHHDFFVRGDYAYSISGNNIEVLDLANPDPPNILSKSLNLHSIGRYTVKGEISNFVIVGVKAYASYGNGFEIIDISNPKVIKKIAEYNIKHYRLFISQDQKRLYAACGTDGLKVIDVSNIDNIREIAAWEQGGVSVNNVVVSDGRAYVQSNKIEDAPIYGSDFRLRIFDISKI